MYKIERSLNIEPSSVNNERSSNRLWLSTSSASEFFFFFFFSVYFFSKVIELFSPIRDLKV